MHVNTGVVSDSIAGVRQFRTKAQTCKNTKQRKGEFAISSGSPPPTGPDPQTFLVLCLAVPWFLRHRPPSKGKGRQLTTTCNRRSPHTPPMQSAFGGAIAHKSAKALNRDTIKHQLGKQKRQGRHLNNPMHFKTGVVSASIAGAQRSRTKVQTSKNAQQHPKATSPFRQEAHLQQVKIRKPSWCCV